MSEASLPEVTENVGREALLECIATLESIAKDRAILSVLDSSERESLMRAAGAVTKPDRAALRKLAKALRRADRERKDREDELVLHRTGIREARRAPVFETPPVLLPAAESTRGTLNEPRKCYVCKAEFQTVHHFYDQLCSDCAELNWERRNQSADLRGRIALITGARVKIGYHAAIKLLRAGARVIVTTRFPHDAAARFAKEHDFSSFASRLEIFGLDLRHIPSVEAFASELVATLPRLDFILNNACQTVRRPSGFYKHLMERERSSLRELPPHAASLVKETSSDLARLGAASSAELSQRALLPEDRDLGREFFPQGRLDADLQQVDLRNANSWRMRLAEVPTLELLEVQMVNAVAPFVLNARLKPLMMKVPTPDKHIVNVSAMEGQFYRAHKTDKHPHTNMAKAALNMMTRTSAIDYVRDGIHMNSVDTGWITDEDPLEVAARKQEEHGFHPPLDVVDGAARIVDPIFRGFLTGEHLFGLFLKDYRSVPW